MFGERKRGVRRISLARQSGKRSHSECCKSKFDNRIHLCVDFLCAHSALLKVKTPAAFKPSGKNQGGLNSFRKIF